MLVDLKERIDESEIQQLIGYSVFPDPDILEVAVQQYKKEETLQLYGYESEDEIVGIIGFRVTADEKLTIEHIAVKPECRGAGFGRGLILEAIELLRPSQLIVETDEEATEFYRWIGFEIKSLGEKHPGVERFQCTYHTEI